MTDSNKKEYHHDSKGRLHRLDGPAIIEIFESGEIHKEWRYHGKRHREFGPAVIFCNGDKEWWYEGNLHRLDGPAVESDGYNEYWIEGMLYSKADWEEEMKKCYLLPDELFELS
jgi:hypothetical protein